MFYVNYILFMTGIKSLTEDDPKPMSKYAKSQRSKAKKVESISFMIYSDSRENINKAKKKLEDSYNNEFNEKTLSGAYKDAIINLTEKQVSYLPLFSLAASF